MSGRNHQEFDGGDLLGSTDAVFAKEVASWWCARNLSGPHGQWAEASDTVVQGWKMLKTYECTEHFFNQTPFVDQEFEEHVQNVGGSPPGLVDTQATLADVCQCVCVCVLARTLR